MNTPPQTAPLVTPPLMSAPMPAHTNAPLVTHAGEVPAAKPKLAVPENYDPHSISFAQSAAGLLGLKITIDGGRMRIANGTGKSYHIPWNPGRPVSAENWIATLKAVKDGETKSTFA